MISQEVAYLILGMASGVILVGVAEGPPHLRAPGRLPVLALVSAKSTPLGLRCPIPPPSPNSRAPTCVAPCTRSQGRPASTPACPRRGG